MTKKSARVSAIATPPPKSDRNISPESTDGVASTTSVLTTGVGRGRGLLGKLGLRMKNDYVEKKVHNKY